MSKQYNLYSISIWIPVLRSGQFPISTGRVLYCFLIYAYVCLYLYLMCHTYMISRYLLHNQGPDWMF